MFFSKLRLNGFKSFVDPTELRIEPGLTGVVGPNGCGKSNLVEALRWVMGETSAKQMRGGEMEDVIFGGSDSRAPRHVAEVMLEVDNSARRAPAAVNDETELTVIRRIERGKGSGYRVNGKDMRARDVHLLFADAATGARATGLVSQGRIGAIINAKPRDRRHLLEDAANIRGLHSRRHEAELRLRAAETNLARLDDVLTALAGQMDGLRKQARQAARYRSVSDRIRHAEAMLFHLRWQAALAVRADAGARLEDQRLIVAQLTEQAAALSTAVAEATAALPDLRQTEVRAAAELQRLTLALADLEAEDKRVATAKSEAETRHRQADDDLTREARLADEAKVTMGALQEEAATLTAQRAGEDAAMEKAQARLGEANRAAEATEREIAAVTETIATTDARAAALNRQVEQANRRQAQLDQANQDLGRQRAAVEAEAVAPADRAAAEDAVRDTAAAAEAAQTALDAASGEQATAETAQDRSREALRAARAAVGKLDAEIDSLSAALAQISEEGTGHTAPVIAQVTVAPGYEKALAAALGADLDLPVAEEGAADGWRALVAGTDDPSLPAGIEPLGAAVDGPPALGRRLAQIGVVADAQSAQARHGDLRPGQRLVTRDGGLWRWDGLVRTAAESGGQAVRLEQRNRLVAVQAAATAAHGELAQVTAAAQRAGAALAAAEQAERAARDHLRASETARDAARSRQTEIAARLTSVRTKLAALDESAARIAAERAEIAEALTGASDEIATLANVDDLRGEAARLRAHLADSRSELLDARAAHDRLTREAESRRTRLAAIDRDQDNWRDRLAQAGARVEELRTRQAAEIAEIARLAARPAEIAEQRRQLAEAQEAAETARKASAERLAAAETAADETDRQSKTAARGVAEARETMVRAEGELDHANQAVFQLKERIAERLSCAPSEILAQAEIDPESDFPEETALAERLERLTRERENIGPVNLRADQEIEELQEQIAGMEHERDDLTAAIARLRGAIGALNREGRQRLTAAFDAVNGHFQDLFRKLFGGGEARLALTEEDDPFEAGLEIFASPPGKKMQTMSLLSGGEQALTALALVFAAFLTNPAPICVLDEVDAPLDDSNVARFCSLLSDIAATTGTRFLVITHHRMTMARMDRLFGVTMAERGVSQLVSVDLRGAEQLRETG